MKTKPSRSLGKAQPYLHILGCGEAFEAQLGNNSCMLVGATRLAPLILFDCGYQIPERLWSETKLYPKLSHIVLTHLHADHAFGLVPLLVRFQEEKRKRPLVIAGPPGTESWLKQALKLGYPSPFLDLKKRLGFEVVFKTWRDGMRATLSHGIELTAVRTIHSVYNLSYKIEVQGLTPFAVSGDGTLTHAHLALYEGCGLVLQETYTHSKKLLGHTSLKQVLALQKKLRRSPYFGITHCSRLERLSIEKQLREGLLLLEPGLKIHLAKK